jgi:hypothetical protein
MRDLDAHVNLFAEDIQVTRELQGRAHLKRWLDDTLRLQFTGTSHHVGNHVIEFIDENHALGAVYSKNEHETGDQWIIMQMLYWDQYERINGRWYFRRRLPCYWYATDLNQPPTGEKKMRWPGRESYDGAYHELFPSWRDFWDNPPPAPKFWQAQHGAGPSASRSGNRILPSRLASWKTGRKMPLAH